MKNEILYGIGGLLLGGAGIYLLIQQGIIPSPTASIVAITPARASPVRARAVQPAANTVSQYGGKFTPRANGRAFGGIVSAQNIPTQYARAGIGATAQEFSEPMHADLIRID